MITCHPSEVNIQFNPNTNPKVKTKKILPGR